MYGSRKSAGSSVLRALSASNACFTPDKPSLKPVGGVALGPKPPKLRCSWRCTQRRAAKATAGVGKTSSTPRAAAICHRAIHAAGGRDWECAILTRGEKQQQ